MKCFGRHQDQARQFFASPFTFHLSQLEETALVKYFITLLTGIILISV